MHASRSTLRYFQLRCSSECAWRRQGCLRAQVQLCTSAATRRPHHAGTTMISDLVLIMNPHYAERYSYRHSSLKWPDHACKAKKSSGQHDMIERSDCIREDRRNSKSRPARRQDVSPWCDCPSIHRSACRCTWSGTPGISRPHVSNGHF